MEVLRNVKCALYPQIRSYHTLLDHTTPSTTEMITDNVPLVPPLGLCLSFWCVSNQKCKNSVDRWKSKPRWTRGSNSRTFDLWPHSEIGAVAVCGCMRQCTSTSPSTLSPAHAVGKVALLTPKNHHLEHSKPGRAERWRKAFMCINRWCSEKPKKTPPKLTTLACVDQAANGI